MRQRRARRGARYIYVRPYRTLNSSVAFRYSTADKPVVASQQDVNVKPLSAHSISHRDGKSTADNMDCGRIGVDRIGQWANGDSGSPATITGIDHLKRGSLNKVF